MAGPVWYAAATAQVRARLGSLLPASAWEALKQAATSTEAAALLANTPYASTGMRGMTAREAARLAPFLPTAARRLVLWYGRRYELENLKSVLRAVEYRQPPAEAAALLHPPTGPWEALLSAGSVAAVVEDLRGSPYYLPLSGALERYQREGKLFALEAALDLHWFQRLVSLIQRLSGTDRVWAGRLLGHWVAAQNLLWTYRYLRAGLSPEEVINYTLHRAFAFSLPEVRRAALGSPLDLEAKRLGLEAPDGASLEQVELLAARKRHREARQALTGAAFSVAVPIAYLILLEDEAQDLGVLLEAKAQALDAPGLGSHLIGEA